MNKERIWANYCLEKVQQLRNIMSDLILTNGSENGQNGTQMALK